MSIVLPSAPRLGAFASVGKRAERRSRRGARGDAAVAAGDDRQAEGLLLTIITAT